jgi:ProP effector
MEEGPAVGRRPILRLRFPPSSVSKLPATAPASPPPLPLTLLPGGRGLRAVKRLAELQNRFPIAFRYLGAPAPWQPLRIGIHLEIAERAPDLATPLGLLQSALAVYVKHPQYAEGLIEGAARIDLDGNSAGVVTAQQAAAAGARWSKGRRRSQ